MKTNTPRTMVAVTHEGGRADAHQKPLEELKRAVSTCMLFENTFYEKGSDIAARIAALCAQVKPEELAALAVEARTVMKLRHVPLFLVRELARHPGLGYIVHRADHGIVARTLVEVIRRPDEMGEFLSLYWKDRDRPCPACAVHQATIAGRTHLERGTTCEDCGGTGTIKGKKQPLSAQVKKGLARAFTKFGEYSLAKWNRDGAIKLRDALFLCHAKPRDAEQDALWKRLIAGTLATPDTWEVALSGGADKKATWERLLTEGKLGIMALLMNLRNMTDAGVNTAMVNDALRTKAKGSVALPFRFISAAKAAPAFASALNDAMLTVVAGHLDGPTAVVVDISGSMDNQISSKSTLMRYEAASAVAILVREIATDCRVFTFSNNLVEVPNYRGLPLMEGIRKSQDHGGTYLSGALAALKEKVTDLHRIIVITDEQTHDGLPPAWTPRAYLINVAPYKPGLDVHQGWQRISGWSERIVDWMQHQEGIAPAAPEESDE